jgi:vacuolar protein sorting-associated protein 26
VVVSLKYPGKKLEHYGIKVEFMGVIGTALSFWAPSSHATRLAADASLCPVASCLGSELYFDRGNHHEFISLVKELAPPGELSSNATYDFNFAAAEKPHESYQGVNVHLRCAPGVAFALLRGPLLAIPPTPRPAGILFASPFCAG